LVIDIGNLTTDWLVINPGEIVDYGLAGSIPLGIHQVISDFEESFRANHIELVKDISVLPPARVRKAIATGVFESLGKKHPCSEYVAKQPATNSLIPTNVLLSIRRVTWASSG